MKILALGAHPDDIEYGCGGALLLAARAGHAVYLHVMTDGSGNGDTGRVAEQEKAAACLGAQELIWGGFTDTRLAPDRELICAIESSLRTIGPDTVFVHYPDDSHQDHKALSSAAVTACRYIRRVLFYHGFTSLNFVPDTFVDIEPVIGAKHQLLACHASQVKRSYPTGLDILESVDALASYHGFMAKVRYAEGFRALRYLLPI